MVHSHSGFSSPRRRENAFVKNSKFKIRTMSTELNNNYYSDHGSSGSSSNSQSTSWANQRYWSFNQTQSNNRSVDKPRDQNGLSYEDLVTGNCTLLDIMKEFQMNGLDSPYTPHEEKTWGNHADNLVGMGPAGAYLRQKSWPEPDSTPAQRLPRPPRPHSDWIPSTTAHEFNAAEFTTSTPVEENTPTTLASLTEDQLRVLALLHELEKTRGDMQKRSKKTVTECRFCKNNGERESYYRSHALKDALGRVTCPVLRVFVCRRCGASGDHAHTIKYCPLSTTDERLKSAAMMRSVRMSSGRRRTNSLVPSATPSENYMCFGETSPSVIEDTNTYNSYALTSQLDPLWAALEKKLML